MLKKTLKLSLVMATLIPVSQSAFAEAKVKTSSLSMAKISNSNKLPQSCQKMFREGDKLISVAEKQPGTHTQVSQMKSRLSVSKQQILQMDAIMQEKSCDKGLVALNQLKRKY